MGTALTGTQVLSTYSGLLKTSDSAALSGSLKAISDGLGNDSVLQLSNAAARVAGAFEVSGIITYSGGIVYTSSDTNVVSSSTLANVSGLTFTVVAGGVYCIRLAGDLGVVGSAGYKFGIGGTATFTSLRARFYTQPTTSSPNPAGAIAITESSLSGSIPFTSSGGDASVLHADGWFAVNAGGTVTIQFAGSITGSVVSLLKGATFHIVRIA